MNIPETEIPIKNPFFINTERINESIKKVEDAVWKNVVYRAHSDFYTAFRLECKTIAAIFSEVKVMAFRTPAFTIRALCGYVVSVFHKILGCCRFNIVKITVGGNSVKFLKPYSPRRRAKP